MPDAEIVIRRRDGETERWAFELSPDAPLDPDELRVALVREFVGNDVSPEDFVLKFGGTTASPHFELVEQTTIARKRRRID